MFLGNAAALAEANAINATGVLFDAATLVIFDGTQPPQCGLFTTTTPTTGSQLSTAAPPTWGNGVNTTNILAVFTLPAFGSNTVANFTTGSGGATITFGAISNVTANRSGTATWFRVLKGATVNGAGNQISVKGTEVMDGNVGTSASDLNINSTAISSGATVSITSFVYTIVD
jgi:hypothetical protein